MPQQPVLRHKQQLLNCIADDQIDQGKGNVGFDKMLCQAAKRLCFARHFHHTKREGQRCIFQQRNHQIGEYRNRDAERLRQYDPRKSLEPRHSRSIGSLHLPLIHRHHRSPDHFGHVCPRMQAVG